MRGDRRAPALLRAAAGIVCGLLAASQLCAQVWPARPLRLVVPIAAGGQPDVVARALAQELSRRLRQPVVVENRPGAQTNIGMEAVVRSAPDGYTYLLALTSLVINPHMQRLGFDPMRDFAPVALVSRTQFVLLTSPALPLTTVEELIAHARSHPGGASCAHSGGVTQLACALFASLARVTLVQVPYRGNSLITNDIARGDVHMMFENLVGAVQHVRAAHVTALAVTDPALGSEPLRQLPKLSEALPGFEITSWQGVVAPAGTPAPILRRLNTEIGGALGSAEVSRHLSQGGVPPVHQTPEEFGEFLRREHARYARIVRDAGLRAD